MLRRSLPALATLGLLISAAASAQTDFVPVTDYAAVVEGLAVKKLDMAWLGGFTFVQAKAINDQGQITGWMVNAANAYRGFVLTPRP